VSLPLCLVDKLWPELLTLEWRAGLRCTWHHLPDVHEDTKRQPEDDIMRNNEQDAPKKVIWYGRCLLFLSLTIVAYSTTTSCRYQGWSNMCSGRFLEPKA